MKTKNPNNIFIKINKDKYLSKEQAEIKVKEFKEKGKNAFKKSCKLWKNQKEHIIRYEVYLEVSIKEYNEGLK